MNSKLISGIFFHRIICLHSISDVDWGPAKYSNFVGKMKMGLFQLNNMDSVGIYFVMTVANISFDLFVYKLNKL